MLNMQPASERGIQEFMHGLVTIDCFASSNEVKDLIEWIEKEYDTSAIFKSHLVKALEILQQAAQDFEMKHKKVNHVS